MPVYAEAEQQLLVRFGDRLRTVRLETGWSQEELADRAGLHRTYVGSVERGERNLALLNLYALATALERPVRDLLP